MADPLLALIGAATLIFLGSGAVIALVVMSAQMFLALFRSIGLIK